MNIEIENRELRRQMQKKDYELERLNGQLNDLQEKLDKLTITFKDQIKEQIKNLNEHYDIEKNKLKTQISDQIRANQQLRESQNTDQYRLNQTIDDLNKQLTIQQQTIQSKQQIISNLEQKANAQDERIKSLNNDKINLLEKYNKFCDKNSDLEKKTAKQLELIESLQSKLDKLPIKDQQIQSIQKSYKTEDAQTEPLALDEEVKLLQRNLQDQDVENISLQLKINEKNGLIYAVKSHNMALMERLDQLALRIEQMTHTTLLAEKTKNEFYGLCQEYLDKKKVIVQDNTNLHANIKQYKKEIKIKSRHIHQLNSNIEDLRKIIRDIMNELDIEYHNRETIKAQKDEYKNKVKLANQRIRSLALMMDDVAIKVIDKLFNSELGNQMKSLEAVESQVQILNEKIKIKEGEFKSELAYAKKFIDYYND
ncbi:UNKNOWN [Stylonychia lemnae]|uniref:Uncharacterized protein n=1 Tax=Stylonychia lemnae TaxID=5949 RepID=A0A078BAE8_STYLE|nr:UNKNOWN [Stylonychia lemnae]|eukprot:CDW91530.1 UNKNOWN [Stylonychia lemnae]